jgi:hypothetical protein
MEKKDFCEMIDYLQEVNKATNNGLLLNNKQYLIFDKMYKIMDILLQYVYDQKGFKLIYWFCFTEYFGQNLKGRKPKLFLINDKEYFVHNKETLWILLESECKFNKQNQIK